MTLPADDGLAWLDAAIHREILRLRATYELSLDEFRGLYVSDEQVDRLIGERPELLAGDRLRVKWRPGQQLGRLQEEFGLSREETAAVLVALAPEIDLKYQTLFAYLNNDVTRKWPTVDLLIRLAEVSVSEIGVESALFSEGLLEKVGPVGSHWRAMGVGVSAPVREFLLAASEEPVSGGGVSVTVVEAGFGSDPLAEAREIAACCGRPLIRLRREPADDLSKRLRETLLAARLRGGIAYFEPETFGFESEAPLSVEMRRRLEAVLVSPARKVFGVSSRAGWRVLFEEVDYETVRLTPPLDATGVWAESLARHGVLVSASDLESVSGLFSLYPAQIDRAAAYVARSGGRTLMEAARRQSSTSLESLATRVELLHGWEHLVLPGATLRRLREFASAIRHREKVFRDWAFLRQAGGRAALTALFSGSSGTGKTMSAGVVARELGLELYRIDLSAVVSKYVGETESNLERIFRAAEGSNAILLFDEADALFGKRSEVKDAHDRYANIEVAYLLQRMEAHDGVMILATNLAQNIDEAFSRRVQFEIEYPLPDEGDRGQLWRLLLPEQAPRDPDIDYEFLARQFALAGGDIRNVALDAAFLAAHEDVPIGMSQLVRALARQRKKQGKLPSASEFKQYFEFVRAEGAVKEKANG